MPSSVAADHLPACVLVPDISAPYVRSLSDCGYYFASNTRKRKMKRRTFIKGYALGLGMFSLSPFALIAASHSSPTRRFNVICEFDLKFDERVFPAELWNPLPFDASYQQVKMLKFSGNYDSYNINSDNAYTTRILWSKWDESSQAKKMHIEMEIETRPRSVSLERIRKESGKNLPFPEETGAFLKPTAHIPTDGAVKAFSDRLTKGIDDRFAKVEAIYNWVTENTFRDPKVVGCGVGDAGKMVKSGYFGGKCTDISSLFVALLRAAGIPAREVFGIRLGRSDFADALGKSDAEGFAEITAAQHCRVEYYIPGVGWIPSDPADVTKLELVERLEHSDLKVQALRERYLHSWEMNWVGLNWGRDFILSPTPTQYPINMLAYPYGEIGDEVLDYYAPKQFSYTITSQER